jgi:hypothetical protein
LTESQLNVISQSLTPTRSNATSETSANKQKVDDAICKGAEALGSPPEDANIMNLMMYMQQQEAALRRVERQYQRERDERKDRDDREREERRERERREADERRDRETKSRMELLMMICKQGNK